MHTRSERFPSVRAAALAYRFRESLFALPLLIVVGGMALAVITRVVDGNIGPSPRYLLQMDSGVATTLLSTIAGATITTAGVIFSLTIVSLQLASSQLSPRVMRWFIRDRLSQVVIGLLVATFVYCVLSLPDLDGSSPVPAPPLTVTVAIVLTIATVITIIAHVDHLAHRLEVGQVVREIAAEGSMVIDAVAAAAVHERPAHDADMDVPQNALRLTSPGNGWVSQVHAERLLAAIPAGTTIRLDTRVGAYIHLGQPLVTIWPVPAHPDRVRHKLARAVVVSDSRTMQEDVDFAFRQLVDIGLRALSSAINDPTTAVEATLRVGSLLRRVLSAPPRLPAVAGPEGRILLRPWDLDPKEYIGHGFDQLRQAAPSQPLVAAAILRVLRMLVAHAKESGRPEHLPALREQTELLVDSLERAPDLHPRDLARLKAIAADTTDPADHSRRNPTP
ncbi:DUF2254 domain-containing protein [Mycolicibacter arupensis]|jgi:uncharacterized membrane protein|uniref:DUF2254 domain-containing protein n=1 Tax=Mycolicibacter arupensis TaxID=342002 RepID=A0A0F5MW65_9MYCO|nr:DUF2254 domain-containing protein [Mycolicibacter arupensis]KAA1430076.1 DUF2254 domain-containing protein [Mycolicibacter arupensis]KKB98272.1 hypothetical protein WR43_15330 [Mycolicibacter arupensis]MCV7275809.1 DUF2254 domain-containing protein [Mycolicibacter arupensis]OQZ93178.1 hypothetical protein BST15_18160 [Mycolicibacter arupensis]TXI53847.1 MAG: DUF2254 domain-containing protein [Mycolicibacter arupensis]